MPAERFPFSLCALEDGAIVAMDCGDGFFRARSMRTGMLKNLVEACGEIRRDVIDRFRAEGHVPPPYPECMRIGSGTVGASVVRITASRCAGATEFAVAFYDEDDLSAPALLLIDEQLDEFLTTASTVLAELGMRGAEVEQ